MFQQKMFLNIESIKHFIYFTCFNEVRIFITFYLVLYIYFLLYQTVNLSVSIFLFCMFLLVEQVARAYNGEIYETKHRPIYSICLASVPAAAAFLPGA